MFWSHEVSTVITKDRECALFVCHQVLEEILDGRRFLAAWYSKEREECSEAFVCCYETFLGARVCRLGLFFFFSHFILNFLVCTVCGETVTALVSFPGEELWIHISHLKKRLETKQGPSICFPFVFTTVFIRLQNDQQINGYQPLYLNSPYMEISDSSLNLEGLNCLTWTFVSW